MSLPDLERRLADLAEARNCDLTEFKNHKEDRTSILQAVTRLPLWCRQALPEIDESLASLEAESKDQN
ncbi:MAG: hypothetical protein EOM25_03390 [Deltaproteobacteria bacterium]|nr:hypothetical protein [Deltaproteobacteria bacterium]